MATSSSCVLCTLCCQFLWIVFVLFVFVLCPVYPMLPVSLDCSSSCVPYVTSFSVFFFVLCTLCCQFIWIFLFWLALRYSLMFISMNKKDVLFFMYFNINIYIYRCSVNRFLMCTSFAWLYQEIETLSTYTDGWFNLSIPN